MTQHIETTGNVKIHVDRQQFHSPNPTTGAALYQLTNVGDGNDLFREVGDHLEGSPVPDDDTEILLENDVRFRSGKGPAPDFRIIVNAEPKEVHKKVLTFQEVVQLAFPGGPTGPNVIYTVTFKKAAGPVQSGSLVEGGTVKIKNGTIFSVTVTDKS